jgi:hypothetical protein
MQEAQRLFTPSDGHRRRHSCINASLSRRWKLRCAQPWCTAQSEHPVKCAHTCTAPRTIDRSGETVGDWLEPRSQAPVSERGGWPLPGRLCAMARELLRLCWLRRHLAGPRVDGGAPTCESSPTTGMHRMTPMAAASKNWRSAAAAETALPSSSLGPRPCPRWD